MAVMATDDSRPCRASPPPSWRRCAASLGNMPDRRCGRASRGAVPRC